MQFSAVRDREAVRALYGNDYYEIYGGVDAGYDAEPDLRIYEARRRLAFLRRFRAGGRLLEIGSAAGYFLDGAQRGGFDVVGVEPAEEQARHARERFGVDARAGFVEDAELEPASFDAVCAWHVLEHILDPVPELRRLHATLRAGGILAVEVPNAAGAQARRLGSAWPHWDPAHHVGHFTPAALTAAVRRAGFTVEALDTLPGTAYYPPGRVVRPTVLVGYALEALYLRTVPRRAHPVKHELLRLIALRP